MKKMECQNIQLSGDYMAVQLYLLLEHKYVLPKLSEGPWSLVIFLKKKKESYTASGKEISYICVTLLSGFNGAYEENTN